MIYLDNRQNIIEVDDKLNDLVRTVIDYALKEEGVRIPYEISLLYVNNEEIKEINGLHRDIDKETDVLSFPMLEYSKGKVFKDIYINQMFPQEFFDDEYLVLGDIVISLEKAKAQCEEYNHNFNREVLYLCVHSVLHLLGYDHMEEEEKKIMRKREEEILGAFSIKR